MIGIAFAFWDGFAPAIGGSMMIDVTTLIEGAQDWGINPSGAFIASRFRVLIYFFITKFPKPIHRKVSHGEE